MKLRKRKIFGRLTAMSLCFHQRVVKILDESLLLDARLRKQTKLARL